MPLDYRLRIFRLHHVHCTASCKYMVAVENETDEGTLKAFSSEDSEDDAKPEDCDCDGLNGFPAGRAFVRDEKNCRTNHGFSLFYPWHAN
ncbi:hypothetical protein [Haladaptatus pallidirubidus]|uniref:hypothetical protein n=1 Tax=Haladaptatus pallidirubidus TaxID=1008152 RepID=UPI0031E6AC65